ncbi:MAG: peptidylprolyl isomerase [Acidobacteria bacterium]|nr:peptidylprolyl isomerase [Acidobacteriota bacterium]
MPQLLLALLLFGLSGAAPVLAGQDPPRAFFVSALSADDIRSKQAVLETEQGTIVLDLLDEAAPNHVAHFITRAREGVFDGTIFHRVIAMGIVQGGDPLSKDPARRGEYGTGGLGVLRFEPNAERATRGAVAAVLGGADRDSAGSQFFICVTDQPALDGQYTVFARVVEGVAVAQRISQLPADADGAPSERVVLRRVSIRDTPPPEPEPFVDESPDGLGRYRAVIETSMGPITLEFLPDRAPNHVRAFLRMAASGVYDGTAFHRVAPGFVIQGGYLASRRDALDERQQGFVRALQPEFNDTLHERGTVSMARGDDPASATSSFFIVLGRTPALDGQYSAFGRVVEGQDVIDRIEGVPRNGEEPVTRIEVTRVRVVAP